MSAYISLSIATCRAYKCINVSAKFDENLWICLGMNLWTKLSSSLINNELAVILELQ